MLGDLGITADVFRLCQFPLRYLEVTRRLTYLEQERECIQREIGFATLLQRQVKTDEAHTKEHLEAARVFLRIAPHLFYDREPGEVPAGITYTRLTNRPAKYLTTKTTASARQGRRRRQAQSAHDLR